MAFKFFRKRQKMVVIIMAALMVSFLIGFQGFQMLTRKDPSDVVRGHTRYGKITQADYRSAVNSFELLELMGLSRRPPEFPTVVELLLVQTNQNAPLAYALLLAEAQASGAEVIERDVNRFFAQIGLSGDDYQGLVNELRIEHKVSEKRLRGVVANWLLINKTFRAAVVASPPPEPEVRQLFRDLNEKITLRLAAVAPEPFLSKVAEPTEQQITEQFEKFRDVPAGTIRDIHSFGFGYRRPNRVRIAYLLVRRDVVARVAAPTDEEISEFHRDLANKDLFFKDVPVPTSAATTTSAPATSGPAATEPATEPAEEPKTQRVPMTPAETREFIVERLSAQAADGLITRIAGRMEEFLAEPRAGGESDGAGLYRRVRERMISSADRILARKISVSLRAERLDRAMEMLAEEARLKAICYPWGAHGDVTVDPEVRVRLDARAMTLGEALARITRQVFGGGAATQPATAPASKPATQPAGWPRLRWVRCAEVDGVIFPTDDLDLFPVDFAATEMLDRRQVFEHEVLGRAATAATARGRPLSVIAFAADQLERPPGQAAQIRVGEDGPPMLVFGEAPGRLLWRLIGASRARAPQHAALNSDEELLTQVKADLKLQAAFERAKQRAAEIEAAARKVGLAAAAKTHDLETSVTEPFARKVVVSPREQFYREVYRSELGKLWPRLMDGSLEREDLERLGERIKARARLLASPLKPYEFLWNDLGDVGLPEVACRPAIEKAFALVPENVEPPYPDKPYRLAVLPVPAKRQVLVMQRVGYVPPVIVDYETVARTELLLALGELRRWRDRTAWFDFDHVVRRTEFVAERE